MIAACRHKAPVGPELPSIRAVGRSSISTSDGLAAEDVGEGRAAAAVRSRHLRDRGSRGLARGDGELRVGDGVSQSVSRMVARRSPSSVDPERVAVDAVGEGNIGVRKGSGRRGIGTEGGLRGGVNGDGRGDSGHID